MVKFNVIAQEVLKFLNFNCHLSHQSNFSHLITPFT